jgi:ribosome-binding factor A
MQRLEEDVRRELAAAMFDLKDPRANAATLTVTRCELTRDMSYCKVYIARYGLNKGDTDVKTAVKVLEGASGFFKRRLNERLKMHKMPQLIFIADDSSDNYERITGIIKGFTPAAASEEIEEIEDSEDSGESGDNSAEDKE